MKKKLIVITLIALMFISLMGTALAQEGSFKILYTNKIEDESQLKENDGLAFNQVKEKVEKYQNDSNIIMVDVGDTLYDQTIINKNSGKDAIQNMNEIGYSAMVLGNDEFNFGQTRIKELEKMANFNFLAANLQPQLVDSYIIKKVDGIQVGIFGLATPATIEKTHADNIKGLTFRDPYQTAAEMVAELSSQTDIIVVLSHLGTDKNSEFNSQDLARGVSGIDIIIDGQSRGDIEKSMLIDGTLIAQAGQYDRNIGMVEVTCSDGETTARAALIPEEKQAEVKDDEKETENKRLAPT
jgi:2',3'-cyclic-nucleotide 2'-phosphodiesterase (5'-nucleotidase family)